MVVFIKIVSSCFQTGAPGSSTPPGSSDQPTPSVSTSDKEQKFTIFISNLDFKTTPEQIKAVSWKILPLLPHSSRFAPLAGAGRRRGSTSALSRDEQAAQRLRFCRSWLGEEYAGGTSEGSNSYRWTTDAGWLANLCHYCRSLTQFHDLDSDQRSWETTNIQVCHWYGKKQGVCSECALWLYRSTVEGESFQCILMKAERGEISWGVAPLRLIQLVVRVRVCTSVP